jgi:S-methylmethionine-dependent homocysteine/selenocysteine methylase
VRALVLDGPMGTELARRGVATPQRVWSAKAIESAPEVIASIHREYAEAGATVHIANTFRTRPGSAGDRWRLLSERAIRIARESVPSDHKVAGAVAPAEDCYRPDLSPETASRPEHRECARALAAAGVDLLICETFANPVEAVVAVEECVSTGLPTWIALTAGPDGRLLSPQAMGETAQACVRAGAEAVLVNCTPASVTHSYLQRIVELPVRVGAYANAGESAEGLGWGATPSDAALRYARLASGWLDQGALIVGGCCGTRPEHVAALAALVRARSS